jgi:hypothetical protein
MKSADLFEVMRRLGEKKTPLLDERAFVPAPLEPPLFLKEDHVRRGFEC